jgi:hypothetical protein
MKRYFLTAVFRKGAGFTDLTTVTGGSFPSRLDIRNALLGLDPTIQENEFIIINIFEFKSESDFLDYKGQR